MNKLNVGDKLYDYSLKEYTVSKIGRRYAHLEGREGYRVDMGTMQVRFWNGSMRLYPDRQAVADEKEHGLLLSKIREHLRLLSGRPTTLEQLRLIDKILNP